MCSADDTPDHERVGHPPLSERDDAIPTLVELLAPTKNLSISARSEIQEVITGGLRESSMSVHVDTVRALETFGTPEVIPVLEETAKI